MRRFGYDMLYPTARYVQALTQPTLTLQSDGKTTVAHPLFPSASGLEQRSPDQIFLAGIVGVPWQDIADDASLHGAGLTYSTTRQLTEKGRWSVLLDHEGSLGQPPAVGATPGYCYIDDPTSPLLKNCPDTAQRKLQFVSTPDERTPTPRRGDVRCLFGGAAQYVRVERWELNVVVKCR